MRDEHNRAGRPRPRRARRRKQGARRAVQIRRVAYATSFGGSSAEASLGGSGAWSTAIATSPLRWRAERRQDNKSDRGSPAAEHSRLGGGEVGRRQRRSRLDAIGIVGVWPARTIAIEKCDRAPAAPPAVAFWHGGAHLDEDVPVRVLARLRFSGDQQALGRPPLRRIAAVSKGRAETAAFAYCACCRTG